MVACGTDEGNGCAGTGYGGVSPSEIIKAGLAPENEDRAIYNYVITHPDYNSAVDPKLEDTGKFIVANALFLGNADYAYRQPNILDRIKASCTAFSSGAGLALAGIIAWGSDSGGGDLNGSFGWREIIESPQAMRQADKLSPKIKQSYEDVVEKLASGDFRGLNNHSLTGDRAGEWAVDIPGVGRGRGQGRVIYRNNSDGSIEIVQITTIHNYR